MEDGKVEGTDVEDDEFVFDHGFALIEVHLLVRGDVLPCHCSFVRVHVCLVRSWVYYLPSILSTT